MKLNINSLFLWVCLVGLLFTSCSHSTFRTFEKPIIYDSVRKNLSLKYMKEHYGMKKQTPSIKPVMVVLHWTVIPSVETTFDALNPPVLPNSRADIQTASSLNVAAHYLVDRDGTIFHLMPDTLFARHVIGLNYCAIGVENFGSDTHPLTRAQLKANVALIKYLKKRFPLEYVIGHYEYKKFIGSSLWKEKDPNYLTEKSDPGVSFMKKVRKRIKELNLKSSPIDKDEG